MEIRLFTMEDYPAAYALWSSMPGIGLSDSDGEDEIRSFLLRNPDLSYVAVNDGGTIVGTVLAGHDGRRGFLYHLAVHPGFRGQKAGERLVSAALQALRRQNIIKCHIMVLADNEIGQGFWSKIGWLKRDNLIIYSMNVPGATGGSEDPCSC
jgi:N-acetylglutamate synthase